MSRKSIIAFVLIAGVVAGALVFDGVSHRHAANSNQAILQDSTALSATGQPNSNADAEAQTAADATLGADPGQNAPSSNDSQAQTEADATAAGGAQAGDDATAADAPQPDDAAPADAQQPSIIPAGTTLTIRLGEDLGSRISRANQRFAATLDRDIVVGGQTVIAAGTNVTGKIVAAKPAGALAGEANLQLKLTSVNLNNAHMVVVTSVRSFGPKIKGKNKVGRFMKGLVKRADGQEREVLLAEQSAYSFTLQRRLEIQ
ncbi:MAG: hypothetical protein WCC04_02855 [Terriglobales bacterium]